MVLSMGIPTYESHYLSYRHYELHQLHYLRIGANVDSFCCREYFPKNGEKSIQIPRLFPPNDQKWKNHGEKTGKTYQVIGGESAAIPTHS